MTQELEFALSTTHDGKTYEGQRVVTVENGKATQYIISIQFGQSITDHHPYSYPEDNDRMEAAGRIIFAELLHKVGVL